MRTLLLTAALAAAAGPAGAQQRPPAAPPHEFLFGSWTGGIAPALDNEGPRCFAQPTLIFTRDIVMRASPLDIAYRQRAIETVAQTADGVEFRFIPAAAPGGRTPSDAGFGCAGPDLLRVERRGADEIVFPDCTQFPFPLRRCVTR